MYQILLETFQEDQCYFESLINCPSYRVYRVFWMEVMVYYQHMLVDPGYIPDSHSLQICSALHDSDGVGEIFSKT